MSDIKIQHSRIYSNIYEYMIPKKIGAYVITHTFDNVNVKKYAGSTKNLHYRMHSQDHNTKKVIYVDLYMTNDIDLAESVERILINLIKPASNKLLPSLSDKDKEIMKELLEDNLIKEHLSEKIMKIGCRYLKYINGDENSLKKIITTPKIRKNKSLFPKARRTRKSGDSIVIALTDFAEEKELYIIKKEGNVITLTNLKIENDGN